MACGLYDLTCAALPIWPHENGLMVSYLQTVASCTGATSQAQPGITPSSVPMLYARACLCKCGCCCSWLQVQVHPMQA